MLCSNGSLQNGCPDLDPVHVVFEAAANEASDSVQAADKEDRQAVVDSTEHQSGQGQEDQVEG